MTKYVLICAAIATAGIACTKQQGKAFFSYAEDARVIGCIIANAYSRTPEIQKACQLADALVPLIEHTVSAHRAGVEREVKERAGKAQCPPSASGIIIPEYRSAYGEGTEL